MAEGERCFGELRSKCVIAVMFDGNSASDFTYCVFVCFSGSGEEGHRPLFRKKSEGEK